MIGLAIATRGGARTARVRLREIGAVAQIRIIGEIVRNEALAGIPQAEYECLLDLLLTVRSNLSRVADTASLAMG